MVMHYCDLHDDCNTCKLPFCPYEKLDSWGQDDGWDEIDDADVDENEGW